MKDEIDFVIWTGDSARHDNDEKLPRSADEILDLNTYLSQKWVEIFNVNRASSGSSSSSVPRLSVPVIPTFGNNDIMPHNIFDEGPNKWTKRFAEIWNAFIPEDQRHTFVLGGWFTTEVVPGRLAVISLNTMYFFDSNSAVDGCEAKSEPGYEHMEWLRIQLKILRSRNMKAILMGHVPPAHSREKQNWDETCWQKYTLWMHQYRDVIVGTFYGHMNIDHFIMQDSKKVKIAAQEVSTNSKSDYLESLRAQWSSLPSPPSGAFDELEAEEDVDAFKKGKHDKKKRKFLKKIGGPWAERYSVSLVSPSLVPNYFPSLRVIDYNVSGSEGAAIWPVSSDIEDSLSELDYYNQIDSFESSDDTAPETQKKKKKKKKGKKPNFKVPEGPSPTAPPGPAYSNQPFTLLGYTQYYANITRIQEELDAAPSADPRLDFEIEYTTNDDVYQMQDLTVRSFFQLAGRMADADTSSSDWSAQKKKPKANKVWRAFLRRAFVGYENIDDLD